ncbi:MAG: hypothetical protein ACOCX4_08825, partial [Planctomycetota bacterium]
AAALALDAAFGGAGPDLLLLFALATQTRAAPDAAIRGWWWCGAVRDVALGPRFGGSMLLFLAAGRLDVATRGRLRRGRLGTEVLVALFLSAALRGVEAIGLGWATFRTHPIPTLREAGLGALVTAACTPLALWLFAPPRQADAPVPRDATAGL